MMINVNERLCPMGLNAPLAVLAMNTQGDGGACTFVPYGQVSEERGGSRLSMKYLPEVLRKNPFVCGNMSSHTGNVVVATYDGSQVEEVHCGQDKTQPLATNMSCIVKSIAPCGANGNVYFAYGKDATSKAIDVTTMIDSRVGEIKGKHVTDGSTCTARLPLEGDRMYLRYNELSMCVEIVDALDNGIVVSTIPVELFKKQPRFAAKLSSIDVATINGITYVGLVATDGRMNLVTVLMLDHSYHVKRQFCCYDLRVNSFANASIKFFVRSDCEIFVYVLGHNKSDKTYAVEWTLTPVPPADQFYLCGGELLEAPSNNEAIVCMDHTPYDPSAGVVKLYNKSTKDYTVRYTTMSDDEDGDH